MSDILREAARWLERSGKPLWQDDELLPSRITADVDAGLRAVYEHFGFKHHSDRQVGPYFVSRYEYDVTKLST